MNFESITSDLPPVIVKTLFSEPAIIFFKIAGIIALSILLLKIAFKIISHIPAMLEKSRLNKNDARMNLRTQTITNVVRGLCILAVGIIAPVSIMTVLGINIVALLTGMGFLGLAISFGTQNLVKDVINGFFILLEDQYGVGDIIKIDSHQGYVEDMNLRTTILRDTNGNVHIIPNGEIKQVTIMTKLWSNAVIDTSVNYKQDIDRVISIIQAEADKLAAEMNQIIIEPPKVKGVHEISGNSATIRTMFKTIPSEQWKVSREFNKRIILAFNREKIEV